MNELEIGCVTASRKVKHVIDMTWSLLHLAMFEINIYQTSAPFPYQEAKSYKSSATFFFAPMKRKKYKEYCINSYGDPVYNEEGLDTSYLEWNKYRIFW